MRAGGGAGGRRGGTRDRRYRVRRRAGPGLRCGGARRGRGRAARDAAVPRRRRAGRAARALPAPSRRERAGPDRLPAGQRGLPAGDSRRAGGAPADRRLQGRPGRPGPHAADRGRGARAARRRPAHLLQWDAYRRDVGPAVPRGRRVRLLLGGVLLRAGHRDGVLPRVPGGRRGPGRRAAGRLLPPVRAAAPVRHRVRRVPRQGRGAPRRAGRGTGAAAAVRTRPGARAPARRADRAGPAGVRMTPLVTQVRITPVAVQDPPLLNSVGVHEPYALRAVLEVDTDTGLTGLSEAYGDDATLGRLRQAATVLDGLSIWDFNGLTRRVAVALGEVDPDTPTELAGPASVQKAVAAVVSAFEVALYDLQGKATGQRVCDLLGGAARDAVPFSAYLFYKWAGHPGATADGFGEALDP